MSQQAAAQRPSWLFSHTPPPHPTHTYAAPRCAAGGQGRGGHRAGGGAHRCRHERGAAAAQGARAGGQVCGARDRDQGGWGWASPFKGEEAGSGPWGKGLEGEKGRMEGGWVKIEQESVGACFAAEQAAAGKGAAASSACPHCRVGDGRLSAGCSQVAQNASVALAEAPALPRGARPPGCATL